VGFQHVYEGNAWEAPVDYFDRYLVVQSEHWFNDAMNKHFLLLYSLSYMVCNIFRSVPSNGASYSKCVSIHNSPLVQVACDEEYERETGNHVLENI
jgi:hypothetical protein